MASPTQPLRRKLRAYLLVSGVSAHLLALAFFTLLHLRFPDHGLGEILHKGQLRLSKNHPTVASAIGAAGSAIGLKPALKAQKITLPAFPGPQAWPAQGTAADGFQRIGYDRQGIPQQTAPGRFERSDTDNIVDVNDESSLAKALREAEAGDVITLSPGIIASANGGAVSPAAGCGHPEHQASVASRSNSTPSKASSWTNPTGYSKIFTSAAPATVTPSAKRFPISGSCCSSNCATTAYRFQRPNQGQRPIQQQG